MVDAPRTQHARESAIARAVRDATRGAWRVVGTSANGGALRIDVRAGGVALTVTVDRAGAVERSYRTVGERAYGYRASSQLDRSALAELDRVIASLAALPAEALAGDRAPMLGARALPPLADVALEEIDDGGDLIGAMSRGESLGVIVRGALPREEVESALASLATAPFPLTRTPVFRGVVYGRPLVAAGEGLEAYLSDAVRFREACAAVFGGSPSLEDRLARVLSALAGGRVARTPEREGRAFPAASIRALVAGDRLPLHYENETFDRSVMAPIVDALDRTTLMSFVMSLAQPEAGGELRVYAADFGSTGPDFIPRAGGEDGARALLEEAGRVTLDLRPGDLVAFDAGRYYHEVTRVGRDRRVTLGGFFAPSRDGAEILYWG